MSRKVFVETMTMWFMQGTGPLTTLAMSGGLEGKDPYAPA